MLVLSRKPGEALKMTGGITVVIVKVSGDQVTIAVDAPLTVKILRAEIEDRFPPPTEGRKQ